MAMGMVRIMIALTIYSIRDDFPFQYGCILGFLDTLAALELDPVTIVTQFQFLKLV